ncbi:putative membrane protein [Chryseobacterium sp. H1D6B]|uniref:DUF2339 domain-containing protein n=1 Tax=Chryseobacterium sp. H1D6B TaxID=2940588 RepID=UPI0015C954C3|nr:DUF2339 domain-containing protein [Chryseobacterium sp. H1D6B]MDH6253225.1 putative membrane protein [Chryseobacterium sp. H1D6B]
MIYFLIIILITALLLIYNKLTHRIQKLENEIFELNKKILNKNNPLPEITEEKKNSADTTTLTENIQEKKSSEEKNTTETKEEIHHEPQKDWMGPIFDFLKQNALTIIGIFTLVLGIGYFVKYAIDKNWISETARLAIGLCTGAGIMVIGHFIRKNYSSFSSIIIGGGIAVLYFSVTIAFQEYHLFSQNTAFILISLITLISIVLSYYYKSEVLIIFSLFGGFLAPLMISTGQSNYPFLFTYLMVLNIGMLIIAFLKHWKSIGWIAFIFTSIYLFYWVFEKTEILSVYFYVASYIIFYAFALQNYVKKNTLVTLDILMLILINFSSITGLVYIFNQLNYEPVIIFPIIFAAVNGLLLFREYSRKNFETNYSVFAGITISLVTLAFALQFKTDLITSVWAVEAALLLFIWKKTNLTIFRICFYILFPLVIISQMTTWAGYFSAKDLKIIFNPIFLTSSVTIITVLSNLFLLKRFSENNKSKNSFFENVFSVISYGVIYIAVLLEIIYHISHKPDSIILSTAFLYSIYYVLILLILRKKLDIGKEIETGLIYLFLFLIIMHAGAAGSEVVTAVLERKISQHFYGIYLLYLIPFIYTGLKIIPKSSFLNFKAGYWFIGAVITAAASLELYHLYILGNARNITESYQLQKHFNILYLPIIWTVTASIFIYRGLKSNIAELNKIGFTLIGIMVLKLYVYDVWQMDNISRVIAFIILGLILLLSSFMFQRLKNIIKNLVDKKEENSENQNVNP